MWKNPKNWWKSMKIANIDGERFHIFWTTWGISMEFSWKMSYDNSQGNEKHGSTLSLEDTFLGKLQEGSNWPPPASLGIKIFLN